MFEEIGDVYSKKGKTSKVFRCEHPLFFFTIVFRAFGTLEAF